MAEETKVRVRIDTRSAKAQLNNLMKTARKAPGRIAARIRGEALRGVGLGAGIGIGIQAVRSPAASGFGDVIGEAFGGWGEVVRETLFGNLTSEAAGRKAARNDLQQAYGMIAGAQDWKSLPTGVREQFKFLQQRHQMEARGREIIRSQTYNSGDFIDRLIKQLSSAFSKLLSDAVDNLWNMLNSKLPW
jgi:hypothetical protein